MIIIFIFRLIICWGFARHTWERRADGLMECGICLWREEPICMKCGAKL